MGNRRRRDLLLAFRERSWRRNSISEAAPIVVAVRCVSHYMSVIYLSNLSSIADKSASVINEVAYRDAFMLDGQSASGRYLDTAVPAIRSPSYFDNMSSFQRDKSRRRRLAITSTEVSSLERLYFSSLFQTSLSKGTQIPRCDFSSSAINAIYNVNMHYVM